jgi:ubiquitin-protein ligase
MVTFSTLIDEMAEQRIRNEIKRNEYELIDFEGMIQSLDMIVGNLLHWKAAIHGPRGSPYEGGHFVLEISIPEQYPLRAPHVNFRTPICHPNISLNGTICHSV